MSKYKKIFIVLIVAVLVVSSVAVSKTLAKNLIIADTPADNVGIGTSNPQYKLDVDGDVRINGTLFGDVSGYRNLVANNVYNTSITGYKYTNGKVVTSGNVNRIIFSKEGSYTTNTAKILTDGYYSVSFWYKVENYVSGTSVTVDINDQQISTFDISGNKTWTFYSDTKYITTNTYGFMDMSGTFDADVTVSDIMVTRSAKPAEQYIPAPEDLVKYSSNGNVGINDSSPNYNLDVVGTGSFTDSVIVGPTVNNNHAATKSYVDSAITGNADTVDTLHAASFIRSDVDDTFTGKLTASASNRQSGIYGTYDSTKIDHIWSMGTAYKIASDGSNFGNLYGLAYKHTNNPTGGTMAGGHQMVWNVNGVPKSAMGDSGIWTSGNLMANNGSVSAVNGDFSGSVSLGTITNSNHATTKSYVDSAVTLLTTKNEVTNLGTVSFANSTSTDNFILELESKGAFDNYHSIMKASWSYAGNDNILDTGYGSFELAGSVIETWTDNDSNTTRGNIHVRVTRPTTGSGGGQILVYNNQGSGYSPGWRQIWTSTTDGSGSGLDADTVDGLHGSAFMPAGTDNWVNEGGDTMSGELNMGDNEITYVGNLDISDGDGRGIKFWNGSSSYALYMSDADPDLGGVTGYSITSKMSNTDGRGFRWCNTNNECGMSLESFTGQWDLTVSNDVNVGGDVTATAYYYSSDKRLKDNIVSLGGESLEVLDKLNPVSFTWKEDGSASQGFLAQEIEQVLPELVKTNSETGMKAVQYGNLTAVLTAGIKEQQKEIERLENKIEILETKLDILLKR
jgi:hypothetical protein